MIVVDAYFADSIPFHLATAQFFELVRSRLSPGGVVVSNVIGAIEGDDSKLLRSMTKTYRSVFPTVELHPVGGGGELRERDRRRHRGSAAEAERAPGQLGPPARSSRPRRSI